MMTCPSGCDWDCTEPCHEVHEVPQKWRHSPGACPGTKRYWGWGEEFDNFTDNVRERLKNNPDELIGVAASNVLHGMRPDLAHRVAGTRLDPFYVDTRVPMFLQWLERTMELDAIIAEVQADPRFEGTDDTPWGSANLTSCGGQCCGGRPIGTRLDVADD